MNVCMSWKKTNEADQAGHGAKGKGQKAASWKKERFVGWLSGALSGVKNPQQSLEYKQYAKLSYFEGIIHILSNIIPYFYSSQINGERSN